MKVRFNRRWWAAVVVAIAAMVTLLAPAQTASAYVVDSWSGRYGALAWGQASSSPGRIVSLSGYRFEMPQLLVYRNGDVPRYQQEVEITYVLQRWDGKSWAPVGFDRQRHWSDFDAKYPVVGRSVVVPSLVRQPGYFRAKVFVLWGGAAVPNGWSGYTSGTQTMIPNSNSDLLCRQSACLNYGTARGGFYVYG